jgi:hypothetical protein
MEIMLRYRARADESIEERHVHVLNRLSSLSGRWRLASPDSFPPPHLEAGDLGGDVDLGHALGPDVKAALAYTFRSVAYLRDESVHDDHLVLEAPSGAIRIADVITPFRELICAYQPYRATVDADAMRHPDDWERAAELGRLTGVDVDGRDTVYRIPELCYFDAEFCRRAFALTPSELVVRLEPLVECVEEFADGVFILVTSSGDDARLQEVNEAMNSACCTPQESDG